MRLLVQREHPLPGEFYFSFFFFPISHCFYRINFWQEKVAKQDVLKTGVRNRFLVTFGISNSLERQVKIITKCGMRNYTGMNYICPTYVPVLMVNSAIPVESKKGL